MVDFSDPLNMVDASKLASTASSAGHVMVLLLYAIVALVVVYGLIYLLSFKYKVRVRQKQGSSYVVIDTKARQFKGKDGIVRWRLLKYITQSVEAPSSEQVEIGKGGKLCAECDRSIDGTLAWRSRAVSSDDLDVLTPEEKSMALQQMRQAQENYGNNSAWDKVLQFMPIIVPIVVLILLIAFWGDITKSASEVAAIGADGNLKLAEACNNMASVCLNRPLLNGSSSGNPSVFTTPPG